MAPHVTKWGILATGGIAQTFTKDLLTNPSIRNVTDVQHQLVAAASSTSKSRAEDFLKDVDAPSSARAYGSYHELVQDSDVQVIYIATPHSHHFQNTMLCLQAGKHVLIEKPITVNAAQAQKLMETARSKGLFLMEAVWTRFFPLSIKIRELVRSKEIGEIKRVTADLSITETGRDGKLGWDDSHRMVNPDLAGGALLDLGIYALTWNFQVLYHCQDGKAEDRERPKVLAAMNKYYTGADEETAIILQFEKSRNMGIATTSIRCRTYSGDLEKTGPSARIFGDRGEIQVFGQLFRPQAYKVIKDEKVGQLVRCEIPRDEERGGWGHGMYWEADEVARCLRDGKTESETIGWTESLAVMEVMDETRRQGGLEYPAAIESTEYEEMGEMNGKKA